MFLHALLIASGNWFFKTRDALSPIAFALLVLCTRPLLPFGDPRDAWLIAIGTAITLGGQTLRAAVIGYAYVKRGGKDRKVYADTLVTEGFFNHCRNPMYVGNLMILLGLLVAYGSAVAFVVGAAFYLYLYVAITLAEEHYLRGKFGATYDAYAARVNRFALDPRGLRASLASFRYDWPRLVRKEYGTTFAWYATLLLLISRKAYLAHATLDTNVQRGLLVALLIGFALWATARLLKKRGVLGRG